jgi:hypothetical protein
MTNQITSTELNVNGIRYLPADQVEKVEHTGDIKIVVLQRGWGIHWTF